MRIVTGLERFVMHSAAGYRSKRLGLLANQAAVGPAYRHALELIDEALPNGITKIFGPQHGWVGEKQDNMVESAHGRDAKGRPIYSLYGETRRPSPEMLEGLDAILIDLPDVGTRVYTFAQTMSYCLEAAGESGLEIIILDRPNPIGGDAVEGNVLADDCRSFVGLYPAPMRHGMTLGELALYFNSFLTKPAKLNIIKCEGWQRAMYFAETGLPWVLPSPNMPNHTAAWVYPGQVLWEGTNVSEARGTTLPFQLVGAPYIDAEILCRDLAAKKLPGALFRPASFQPTFHKWAGESCQGLELIPVEKSFKPYLTSLCMLESILRRWPDDFKLKEPPYEYEFERRPIDLILGRRDIFDRLKNGESVEAIETGWQDELAAFIKRRRDFLIY